MIEMAEIIVTGWSYAFDTIDEDDEPVRFETETEAYQAASEEFDEQHGADRTSDCANVTLFRYSLDDEGNMIVHERSEERVEYDYVPSDLEEHGLSW